jgi:RecB family exonuclease
MNSIEAIDATARHVLTLKSGNAEGKLAHVAVLVPTHLVGRSVNRALLASGKPLLNVHVETVRQHVERMTEQAVLGNAAIFLDSASATQVVQQAITEGVQDPEHALLAFPAYAWLMKDVIDELRKNLRQNDVADTLKGALPVEKATLLCRILSAYNAIREKRLDYADLLARYQCGNCTRVLYPGLVDEMATLEREAISASEDEIVGIAEGSPATTLPDKRIAAAYSAVHEVREVIRDIRRSGAHFDQVAIVAPRSYFEIVISEADRVDVPVICHGGRAHEPRAVAAFLSLLDAREEDFDYDHLKRYLVLSDKRACLRALSETQARRSLTAYRKGMPEGDYRKARHGKLSELLDDLETLQQLPGDCPDELVDRLLWKCAETQVVKAVCRALRDYDPPLDSGDWVRQVRTQLGGLRQSQGEATGHILLTDDPVPGVFDRVYSIGLSDRNYPHVWKEHPLLLDAERDAINKSSGSTLQTARARNEATADVLTRTIGCAREHWYGLFPMTDLLSGKPERPSPYLFPALQQIDPEFSPEKFETYVDSISLPWLPATGDEAIDEHEWILARVLGGTGADAEGLIGAFPAAARHRIAAAARWDATPGDYTGWSGGDALLEPGDGNAAPCFSPSQLESFTRCPYQWFLQKRLHVKSLDEPERPEQPSALSQGSLVHSVLEECVKPGTPGAISVEDSDSTLRQHVEQFVEKLGGGPSLCVETLVQKLASVLENYAKYAETVPDSEEVISNELNFGFGEHDSPDHPDPVTMTPGQRSFALRGTIDRLSRDGDKAVIIDYKVSNKSGYKDATSVTPGHLQAGLYAEAARQFNEIETCTEIKSGYLPLKDSSESKSMIYGDAERAKLGEICDTILDMIKSGWFPITAECRFCDYQPVCGRGLAKRRDRQSDQTQHVPELQSLGERFTSLFETTEEDA